MNQKALKQEQEKRFIKWAESRDDDWWEDQARISIWDFRVMQEFFSSELTLAREEVAREIIAWIDRKGDTEASKWIIYEHELDELKSKFLDTNK